MKTFMIAFMAFASIAANAAAETIVCSIYQGVEVSRGSPVKAAEGPAFFIKFDVEQKILNAEAMGFDSLACEKSILYTDKSPRYVCSQDEWFQLILSREEAMWLEFRIDRTTVYYGDCTSME